MGINFVLIYDCIYLNATWHSENVIRQKLNCISGILFPIRGFWQ